jgi:hypothetical protein
MTGSQIDALGPIIGVIYKPNGKIRSFLVEWDKERYSFYCKELAAWGKDINLEQLQEIQELLKTPLTRPNRGELQEY